MTELYKRYLAMTVCRYRDEVARLVRDKRIENFSMTSNLLHIVSVATLRHRDRNTLSPPHECLALTHRV
ncbi:hypothetical protein PG988_014133 [Apiospora saccharicola]